MRTSTLEAWTWVLIYGGLIGVGLGLSMRRYDDGMGWATVGLGALATLLGAVCIWIRSRMKNSSTDTKSTKDAQS